MVAFLYRCPATGYDVQGYVADDASEDEADFHPMICPACTRTHLVNPKTGKVLGAADG